MRSIAPLLVFVVLLVTGFGACSESAPSVVIGPEAPKLRAAWTIIR